MNAADVLVKQRDYDRAIDCIRLAVAEGYTDYLSIRDDPDEFAPLVGDPRFASAFTDPELLARRKRRALPPFLRELAEAQPWDGDGMDFEVYLYFKSQSAARATFSAFFPRAPEGALASFLLSGQDGAGGPVLSASA